MLLSVTNVPRSVVYYNGGGTGAVHRFEHGVFDENLECKPGHQNNADQRGVGGLNASNRLHTGVDNTLCGTGFLVDIIGLAGGNASSPQGLHETDDLRKVKTPAISFRGASAAHNYDKCNLARFFLVCRGRFHKRRPPRFLFA